MGLGQFEQSRQLSEDTLTRMRRVLGDDHPHILFAAHTLVVSLGELGQYPQSHQLGEETLTRMRRILVDTRCLVSTLHSPRFVILGTFSA
jgi:tetratricopeptide repeat protein